MMFWSEAIATLAAMSEQVRTTRRATLTAFEVIEQIIDRQARMIDRLCGAHVWLFFQLFAS
jgi:hypothetical protein